MEAKKIGFFTRIKMAVIKFEDYIKFIEEPLKKAFGYFFKLMLIVSLFITIALTYTINKNVENFKTALETEFPKFSVVNNVLEIEEQDKFEYYIEDYKMQIIMDKTQEGYIENDYENCLMLLKDKMFIKYRGFTQEFGYNNIEPFSNEVVISLFETNQWKVLYFNICIMMFGLNFIMYSIILLLDVFTLSIMGLIINTLIRMRFKYQDIVKISIYAMTLPIILYMLYIMANILFGTTIKLFGLAYNAISYIYVITVMLIIKSDVIKNTQELQMILEEQKKVKEELERERQEEKEREKNKGEDEDKDKEKEGKKDKSPQEPQTDNG